VSWHTHAAFDQPNWPAQRVRYNTGCGRGIPPPIEATCGASISMSGPRRGPSESPAHDCTHWRGAWCVAVAVVCRRHDGPRRGADSRDVDDRARWRARCNLGGKASLRVFRQQHTRTHTHRHTGNFHSQRGNLQDLQSPPAAPSLHRHRRGWAAVYCPTRDAAAGNSSNKHKHAGVQLSTPTTRHCAPTRPQHRDQAGRATRRHTQHHPRTAPPRSTSSA
jgi:hypothetical protein